MEQKLPHSGALHRALEKKFKETLVLVPFYGARYQSIKKHVEYFNSIGFDVVTLNLIFNRNPLQFKLSSNLKFGLKYIWLDQISAIFNCIPGPKVVYSFSNPAAATIQAIADRGATDIVGLITDGGPSGNLFESLLRYYQIEQPIKTIPARYLMAQVGLYSISKDWDSELHIDLKKLPKGFPILSIIGWKDPLITPQNIECVFSPHHQLDWIKLGLPQGGHLDGLKNFTQDYQPKVEAFLKRIATSLDQVSSKA